MTVRDQLHYDVVATSFPIVYTAEGDHDPAGLLYTLEHLRAAAASGRASSGTGGTSGCPAPTSAPSASSCSSTPSTGTS